MNSKSKMDSLRIGLSNQMKSFTSINFVAKTSNVIEKLMWITIATCGTILVWRFFIIQMKEWNESPVVKTKVTLDLSKMTSPAVTFCPTMLSKLAVAEGLLNNLDLDKSVPTKVIAVRNEAIKLYWKNRMDKIGCLKKMKLTNLVASLANYHNICCQEQGWCKVSTYL